MTDAKLERLLRRDRAIVAAAIAAIVLLAWTYLAALAPQEMAGKGMPAEHSFVRGGFAGEFVLMFAMWAVMMVGMMLPTAAPTLLLYARVARHSSERGRPFAPTGWFAGGYLLAWTAFAVLATVAQWALTQAALLTPMMASAHRLFGASLLIVAGIYQWTPLKHACLVQCQAPFQFIQRHGGFRADKAGSLLLGIKHGGYCVGCCWALMLLLFLGGVMNLLWIAALAVLVLAEKLLPHAQVVTGVSGAAFVLAGAALAAGMF